MSQIFPILHIIVLVVLLLFLLLLVGGVKKTRLSIYLSFLYVFIIAWLALEFFAMNFEFDGELNALFWKITFSSVAIVSFLTFKTTVSAFNKKINKNFDIFSFILIFFFILLTVFTDKIVAGINPDKFWWGYEVFTGDFFFITILVYSLFLLPSLYIDIKEILTAKERETRMTAIIFALALCSILVVGMMTNLFFPLLNIIFPKLASFGAAVSVVIYMYAIYRGAGFNIKLERLRIKNKIFLVWFITGGVLIGAGITSFYFSSVSIVESLVKKDLQNNLQIKRVWFDHYLDEKKADLNTLSNSPFVKETLANLNVDDVEIATESIENRAREIVQEIDKYLIAHPNKTIKDLQNDSRFQKIALQEIGLTGYSAVANYDTLVCRFHTNPNLVDIYLGELSEEFPDFWSVIKSVQGGKESGGFYEWQDESGDLRQKFMYVVPTQEKTADGVGLAVSANTYVDEYSPATKISEGYDRYFKTFIKDHNYNNLFIIKKNGVIIWKDEEKKGEEIGIDISSQFYPDNYLKESYQGALESKKIIVSDFEKIEKNKVPVFYLAESVFNEDNSEILGVLAMQINADQVNEVLQNRAGLGKTGETYLVGGDYLMRSDSIFLDYSTILNMPVKTKALFSCLKDQNREVETASYIDYRNESVLGAYIYLPENDWCLIGEVDEKEALAPINTILLITVSSGLIFMILVFVISSWLGRIIAKPIVRLREKIKIVEKGNLDYKVGTKARDEVGELSRAFDRLTEAIKESRKEINEKVKKQTEEITRSREMMEDQQKAVLNVLEDVEEEKENVSREKDKINAILHSIGDGVFVVDENYKIIMVNQVTCDISGFAREELIDKRYDEVLKFVYEKDGKTNDEFMVDAIEKGIPKNMSNHTLLVHKNGKKVPVADSSSPLKNKNDEIIGCVVVFRDVEKERQVDKAKTEFVSLASHQLLTPLTSIGWYVEMLVNGDAGKLNKDQKEFLDQIYEGNHRMVELVNSLLNVSRIELGTFSVEPEPIVFSKISDSIIKEMAPDIKSKRMKIIKKYPKDEPEINADPKLIRIIFQNLISNALKYSPSKEKIKVELAVKKPYMEIKVTDNGYGIPKNQQDKIFTKLFRADNVRTKDTTGTGLGLYIVKSIVDQAKGEISFKSQPKKGTTFTVKIPLSGMRPVSGTKKLE